jgi:hypothetical protein
MYHKRKYKPIFPEKYAGDPTNIIMRSSWETKFAIWCDTNPSIIKWSSEQTIIPYVSPLDNRVHRYFVDFKIQTRGKTYLIEIKPEAQTRPPKQTKKTQRFLTEASTYMVNQAKWTYAKRYAQDRNWEFVVLTEKHLGI